MKYDVAQSSHARLSQQLVGAIRKLPCEYDTVVWQRGMQSTGARCMLAARAQAGIKERCFQARANRFCCG